MICLTVTPTSRRLAKVDLLNAAAHADVVELCLDQLAKEPDVGEMIAGVETPIIVSCRRPDDGGHFRGTEEQRLALLRQAVVAGPAYVELEPDAARQIPPFGGTKRIVSHITPDQPLGRIDDLYEEIVRDCRADIVKFTCRTDYLEQAWSLLAEMSKSREKPVVGVGVGQSSRMLQILGTRYGAHWVYAALEPAMAVHENDATLFELEGVYDLRAIGKQTRFVGLVGFPPDAESTTVRVLNAGFRLRDLPFRCLPIHFRRSDRSREMFEKLKITALVVHPESGGKALGVAEHFDEGARQGQCADLVFHQKQGWTAFNLLWRNVAEVLVEALPDSSDGTQGLAKRNVMIVGAGGLAQSVAHGITKFGGGLSVSAPDDAEAQQLAKRFDGRHVPYASLYDTLADVVVFADPDLRIGTSRTEVNPGFLRPSTTVLDVSRIPEEGDLAREARERGCRIVDVAAVYSRQLAQQFEALTRQPLPEEALAALR